MLNTPNSILVRVKTSVKMLLSLRCSRQRAPQTCCLAAEVRDSEEIRGAECSLSASLANSIPGHDLERFGSPLLRRPYD